MNPWFSPMRFRSWIIVAQSGGTYLLMGYPSLGLSSLYRLSGTSVYEEKNNPNAVFRHGSSGIPFVSNSRAASPTDALGATGVANTVQDAFAIEKSLPRASSTSRVFAL